MSAKRCIYCGSETGDSPGDHVVPAALGEFRHGLMFRCICVGCNSRISKREEQVVRSGPAWLIRHILSIPGRRSRADKRKPNVGAAGAPPPAIWAHHQGRILAVTLRDQKFCLESGDHLVVCDEMHHPHVVRLGPRMSAQSLRTAVNRLKLPKITKTYASWSKEHEGTYLRLVSEAWPEAKFEQGSDLEVGEHSMLAQINFSVTPHYFRAMAKIAFHYYLTQSRRFHGHEGHFWPIRDFITGDDNADFARFLREEPVARSPVPPWIVPAWWHHVLSAKEESGQAVATVRLFYGPRLAGEEHTFILGTLSASLLALPSVWAHTYDYFHAPDTGGFAGKVSPVGLMTLRR